ncbi:hypothetical protein A203_21640 [Chromobacterium violaceum]
MLPTRLRFWLWVVPAPSICCINSLLPMVKPRPPPENRPEVSSLWYWNRRLVSVPEVMLRLRPASSVTSPLPATWLAWMLMSRWPLRISVSADTVLPASCVLSWATMSVVVVLLNQPLEWCTVLL